MAKDTRPQEKNRVGSAEIHFAKKLANNDKKIRDRAFVKLKSWLLAKEKTNDGLNFTELLKIWKGLFYCMWYSDKPLVQEELAANLANLIHIFDRSSNNGILFSKVFFVTIGREWIGIDRLRLDKFYFLIKRFIHETLKCLQNLEWNYQNVLQHSKFLTECFLDEKFPDSLKIYLTEKTLPELSVLIDSSDKIPKEDALVLLVEPFLTAIAYTLSDSVFKAVREEVLNKIEALENIEMPLKLIADRLTTLAAEKVVKTRNRKVLHIYARRFHEADSVEGTKSKLKNKSEESVILEQPIIKKKKTGDTETCNDVSMQKSKKKKKKKKKLSQVESIGTELNNNLEKCSDDKTNSFTETNINIALTSDENDNSSCRVNNHAPLISSSSFASQVDSISLPPLINTINPALQVRSNSPVQDVDSTDIAMQVESEHSSEKLTCLVNDTVKQKLDFMSDFEPVDNQSISESTDNTTIKNSLQTPTDITSESNRNNEIISVDQQLCHLVDQSIKNDDDKTEKTSQNIKKDSVEKELKEVKRERRSLRKKNNDKGSPKSLVTYIKTPVTKAFLNRQMRTISGKIKNETDTTSTDFTTPQPEKRKVRIELSKNMAVGHKELKISPLPAFNPLLQPNKSAMKVYSTRSRAKASDFM
ncbi:uncharacterized protein LOC100206113 isoform X2 [Hydra vulgaris]|uniref:Uncharacterized protein LOC100206113 isoform X2 n=1 Tax=Hydra vulgaris TaxID=6087 RepID=A0ABM4B6X9_HYDVU